MSTSVGATASGTPNEMFWMLDVAIRELLCAVVARPTYTSAGKLGPGNTCVPPETQFTPSSEYWPVNVLPTRASLTQPRPLTAPVGAARLNRLVVPSPL